LAGLRGVLCGYVITSLKNINCGTRRTPGWESPRGGQELKADCLSRGMWDGEGLFSLPLLLVDLFYGNERNQEFPSTIS